MHGDGTSDFGSPGAAGRLSCVVDSHPRFHEEVLRWYACLTEVAGVLPSSLTVCHVGHRSHQLDYLERQGVTVRAVPAFDERSPHCNKISGALASAHEAEEGTVVLCDTDIAVLEDPRSIPVMPGAIAAKAVDAPVPPLDMLLRIFGDAGVEPGDPIELPWGPGTTVPGNFNGGLYVTSQPVLSRLAPTWATWARWLLERPMLLGEWTIHVDQVAMALAVASERLTPVLLDVRWNTPTHDLTRVPDDPPVPAVLHYHQEVGPDGCIRSIGRPAVDAQIARANRAFARVRQRTTGSPAPDWRSGTTDGPLEPARDGSRRGSTAPEVDALLLRAVGILRPATVLDVGADLASGIAPSRSVACTRRDLAQIDTATGADLVVAPISLLDGLDDEGRAGVLRRIWQACTRAVLLVDDGSGAALPSSEGRAADLLDRVASVDGGEVYPLGSTGGAGEGCWLALRPPASKHPRDYGPATLSPLVGRHPDPLELVAIRLRAWQTIGFYPDHAPRLWEYPVVARALADSVRRGGRLVDVGAGVTPLVPHLTALGYRVDTVDPSPNRRSWPPQPDWNEWDYLDYHAVGLARRSWNRTLDEIPVRRRYDGLCSVSVIEHLPADDRRALLVEMGRRVKPGGTVVLTVDLVRATDRLWNRSRGLPVEDPLVHGLLGDLEAECAVAGLRVEEMDTVRTWGDVDVDIGYLDCRNDGTARRRARSARHAAA